MKSSQRPQSGFTLLELVIALGIFSLLVVILVGFYSRFVTQQRRDILEQRMLENTRFAIDFFSREVRTAYGSTFALADGRGQGVIFRNQNGFCVHYRFSENNLERAEVNSFRDDCNPRYFPGASYQPLITSDLEMTDTRFSVETASVEDGRLSSQGYISLSFSIRPRTQDTRPIPLQTTVTSRQVTPFSQ